VGQFYVGVDKRLRIFRRQCLERIDQRSKYESSNERPSRLRTASEGWLFGLAPSVQAVHAAWQSVVLLLQWIRSRRNLRLASGLVLFTYVTLHLSCHALGLISVETAEAGLRATVRLWHSWLGTTVLYGAAAVHIGLALLAIYDRRTLRMAPLNGLRIVLGLLMPLSLIGHFVGTRYAFEHFNLSSEYSRIAANLWSGGAQGLTLGLLAPGWLHGCLGLRFAFGHRRVWRRLHMELFGVALLLPVLAGLGFVAMGRALEEQRAGVERQAGPNAVERRALDDMRNAALETYLALIGLVALGRVLRGANERRRMSVVHIAYPGRNTTVPRGWSVLEASRSFGIAHQSMCGGRGRCSTCRVRVVAGADHCPPPGTDEKRTLDRIDAPDTVRLACQLRPTGDITVEVILQVDRSRWISGSTQRPPTEHEVAILFFDLQLDANPARSNASAHDTIYALGRFEEVVAGVVDTSAGVICRRAGDHWLALFGLDSNVHAGCRQALAAGRRIETRATALLERLNLELGLHADFAVGVHAGTVVAGFIGEGQGQMLSAVGDAVASTAGLRQFAVSRSAHFVISRTAAIAAGIDDPTLDWQSAGIDLDGAPLLCADASAMPFAGAAVPMA